MVFTDKERDLPFIYVTSQGSQTTNINQTTDADGGAFHLRKIALGNVSGPTNVGVTNFQVYDRNAVSFMGQLGGLATGSSLVAPVELCIGPEVVYQSGDTLRFDKTAGSAPYTIFYGIRRFASPINPIGVRKGPFVERPFQYTADITAALSGVPDPITPIFGKNSPFSIDVRNYDFELRRIFVINKATAGGVIGAPGIGQFVYTIFNAYGRAMMNASVFDWALSFNANTVTNVFPIPGIVYPVGSQISGFGNNSVAGTEGTTNLAQQLILDGVQRFPCS